MRETPEEPLGQELPPVWREAAEDEAAEERNAEPGEQAGAAAVGDAGWALPTLGAVLLVSPFARLSSGDGVLFGAPVVVVYIFGVWAFLIILAARLAYRAEAAERQSLKNAAQNADASNLREEPFERAQKDGDL